VIVGGGITGLSAAFYLQRAARAGGQPVRCTLIERDPRLGGKILTDTVDDPHGAFVVEGGPDSFVAQKPWGVQLARDLGLGGQLAGTKPARVTTYVLSGGRPVPMPEGMMLAFPTRFLPFAFSPLLSWPGKLRMLADLFLPAKRDDTDETLADFTRRRFGAEALDKLTEPLLAGIHSSDPERQSLLMTFPRFRDMERSHGSIIRAMLAARRKAKSAPKSNTSPFMTLRGGIGELVRALREQITGEIIAGSEVTNLRYDPTAERAYRLTLSGHAPIAADAVIITTPASAAAELLAPLRPALADELRQIRYVTTGTVALAFRRADIGSPLDGYGLIIPSSERRRINALTMVSQKFDQRAPDGTVLIRMFVGGSRTPETVALGDAELLELARGELRDILGITAAPLWTRIYRWPNGNPQYDVGHIERMQRIERELPAGVWLAGSSYNGVGIPDCVRQGQEAAQRALALLAQAQPALA
jgi:oxygen-dependent protoporphyrinogen oxidase